jgi:acyl carrier protein
VSDPVLEKVQELIAENIPLRPGEIRPDATLVKDLGLSSLEIVMVMARVESTFHLRFEAEDMAGFDTVASVVDAIRRRSG